MKKTNTMTRPIKFRAWDKEYEQMYTSKHFSVAFDGRIIPHGRDSWKEDQFVLEQFTGLHDKNGKEIYEGDVVKAKHYHAWRPWWKDLEHKKQIDVSWEKQKQKVYEVARPIEFRDGSFEWGYVSFGDMMMGWKEEVGRYLWEFYKSGEGVGGKGEEKYWDFEVIGNLHQNPELLT